MVKVQTIIGSQCGRFKFGYEHNDDSRDIAVLTALRNSSGAILHSWSGYDEVRGLLKALYTDTHTSEYLDLMFYCSEWGFIFLEVREILSNIYEEAIELGIFIE